MQLAHGDMWDVFGQADLFLITTNGVVNGGRLVMGAGVARQARDRFPGLDAALGRAAAAAGSSYGLLVSPRWPAARLGAFQTKGHWREGLSPALIGLAARKLLAWCREHPDARVHLNLPGVGCGGLDRSAVLPLLEPLPDTVTVWSWRKP